MEPIFHVGAGTKIALNDEIGFWAGEMLGEGGIIKGGADTGLAFGINHVDIQHL